MSSIHVDEIADKVGNFPIKVNELANKSQIIPLAVKADLLASTGAGLVGLGSTQVYPAGTVGDALQHNPLQANVTIKIPTNYPDLQSALNFCSKKSGSQGYGITVLIESGYVITKGYRVDDVDLSHVTLSSVDAEVPVSTTFAHVQTYDLPAGVARGNLFSFVHVRSKAPKWNIVVNHANSITDGGYCLYWSTGFVHNYKGVKNADHDTGGTVEAGAGFKVGGASHLIAPYAVASGCGVGFALTQSTVGDLQYATATSCRFTGIDVSRGSVVYALSAVVDGCLREGFYVRRSRVIAEAASIKNCPIGIRAQATAEVSALNAVFDDTPICVARGNAATVDVTGATKNGVPVATIVGALSPERVNSVDNAGTTLALELPSGSAGQLTKAYTAQASVAGSVSAPGATWTVLHTITGSAREILGGTIYGHNIGMRIIIDGVTALNVVSAASGVDSGADNFTVFTIPPFASLDSFSIEVYNRDASGSRNVGYNVYRRI